MTNWIGRIALGFLAHNAALDLFSPHAHGVASEELADLRRPRSYATFHLQDDEGPIVVDGLLNDTAWENVAYTSPFVDIQGPQHWSQPWFTTRVKMRYDREMLYIGAYLEDTAIWANMTQRNSVIFHDNDFEVFVDADESTHNYKEIELNARNASWNLWLNKPYRSGGHENSTRVDPAHGFDMFGKGFRCAVHVDGPINDPAHQLHYWTVEMALPLKELARHTNATMPATRTRPGGQHLLFGRVIWRINFSRVQWQVRVVEDSDGSRRYQKIPRTRESNWVWSPQYAIDMHRPEWWGYLQFREPTEYPPVDPSTLVAYHDPHWLTRYVAFQLFYAQEAYKGVYRRYATAVDNQLKPFFQDQGSLQHSYKFELNVTARGDFYKAIVRRYPNEAALIQSDSFFKNLSYENKRAQTSVASVE